MSPLATRDPLVPAANLRLALLGQPTISSGSDTDAELVGPLLARQRELSRRLDDRLPPVDERIDHVLFKVEKDPRVTPPGRFIRRFSIDELPQLFNVFRGEMSLVGPRPPLPREVARYDEDARRRLAVRPGMTGLWQVSGRSDLSWEDSVRLDLYYVDNWSVLQDLVILSRTLRAVLGGGGAY